MNVHNNRNDIAIYRKDNFYKCDEVHSKIRDMIKETRHVFACESSVDPDDVLDYMMSLLNVQEEEFTKQTGETTNGK